MSLTPTEPLLRVEGLSRAFGGVQAVSNVRLSLFPGELVGLIGPNGAGKTTLFNLLSGVLRPDRGTILLHGESIVGRPPSAIARRGLVRTFQHTRLFPGLTVLENVMAGLHLHAGVSPLHILFNTPTLHRAERASRQEALGLLALFSLESRAHELASQLPYGEQRRVSLVRALAARPSVLLLDEPAAGLNAAESEDLMDLIDRIHRDFSLTILLIEHHMPLVMGISQRITVLDHGEVIAEGSPAQIQSHPSVIEAYLGVEEA